MENLPLHVDICGVKIDDSLKFFMIRDDLRSIEVYTAILSFNMLKGRESYEAYRADMENSSVKVVNHEKNEILLSAGQIDSFEYQISVHERYGLVEILRLNLKSQVLNSASVATAPLDTTTSTSTDIPLADIDMTPPE